MKKFSTAFKSVIVLKSIILFRPLKVIQTFIPILKKNCPKFSAAAPSGIALCRYRNSSPLRKKTNIFENRFSSSKITKDLEPLSMLFLVTALLFFKSSAIFSNPMVEVSSQNVSFGNLDLGNYQVCELQQSYILFPNSRKELPCKIWEEKTFDGFLRLVIGEDTASNLQNSKQSSQNSNPNSQNSNPNSQSPKPISQELKAAENIREMEYSIWKDSVRAKILINVGAEIWKLESVLVRGEKPFVYLTGKDPKNRYRVIKVEP